MTGDRNAYNLPISIELFAPREVSSEVLAQIASRFDLSDRMVIGSRSRPAPTSTPLSRRQPQYTSASTVDIGAAQYDTLVQRSITIDSRTLRDAPEKFGLSIQDLEALPLAKQPTQVKTEMLSYQLQGLAWLLKMEHPQLPGGDEVKQFWTKRGGNWFNIATHL